jgi:hypothetical protein
MYALKLPSFIPMIWSFKSKLDGERPFPSMMSAVLRKARICASIDLTKAMGPVVSGFV